MKLLAFLLLLPALAFGQSLNPAVTQANIASTICVSGWTATIRPPVSYTNRVKRELMARAGLPWSDAAQFELDHAQPLALGGAPRDPANLRLQSWDGPNGAHAKDVVEARLHRAVCAHRMTLAKARACMVKDWRSCP